MSFEKFGAKSFTSQTKVNAFVNYLEKGELYTTKCPVCEKLLFPPQADCPSCLGGNMEWVPLENYGTLISYTQVNYAPSGFEADLPYVLALAKFNGVKVFGRMKAQISWSSLKVGMEVKYQVLKLPNDQIAYEFVPHVKDSVS